MASNNGKALRRYNDFDIAEGWYVSTQWKECVETFDRWDADVFNCIEFNEPICYEHFKTATEKLVDCLYDTAKIDPMPIWEVFLKVRDANEGQPVAGLGWAYYRTQMLYGRVLRVGLSDTEPAKSAGKRGRPESDLTRWRRLSVRRCYEQGEKSPTKIADLIDSQPGKPIGVKVNAEVVSKDLGFIRGDAPPNPPK